MSQSYLWGADLRAPVVCRVWPSLYSASLADGTFIPLVFSFLVLGRGQLHTSFSGQLT